MESLIKEEVDVDATPPPAATSSSSTHSEPPQASPDNNGVPSHSPTRIPKKNQPPMTLHSNSSNNDNNTESLVLPNGVHLPPTVTPQMLDGRLRRAFLDLTPAQMRAVLEEYDESVNQKGEEIRNRVAYLFGVVKRHKVASERAQYGGGEYTPQGNTISVRVQTRLDELISSGFCNSSEIDAKIKDRMRMLPERDALDAIDELNGCSRAEIRNFASYFMGIMNKYMKGERKDPRSRGANRVRNPRDGQSNNKIDDRFSHYGRNDDPQHGSSPRHRRDGRGDGRDRQSTSTRDNGRDHHRSSRRRSRSRSRSYDSRSRSRSPDYRRRRRSRSRSDSRDRHHSSSSRRHNRSSRDHARTSSSHRDQNNIPPTFGQNPPGSMAHHNMVPPPPPPPQRPQNMMQQTMTMGQQQQLLTPQMMVHGGLQRPMQPQQPQQFVQSIGQIPQLGQGTTDAQLQPFLQQYQQQLLQQQFQQSVPGSSMPQPSLQQLQQLQNYTQNMQQLNQAGKMMSGSHVAGLTNMILGQQQQGSGSQPPGNANNNLYSSVQNQNPDQQPLLDIFGLADKAAQALSAGRLPQVNPTAASVGTMSNPNFPPMLNASNLSAPTYQPHQQQSNTPSRQHNTATESDLPVMVKYAIQNLRTTGHIESALDAPLIGMLQRLPENAALSALEIFSSCDLSKMRSKSAYLAGILKKELAKLGLH